MRVTFSSLYEKVAEALASKDTETVKQVIPELTAIVSTLPEAFKGVAVKKIAFFFLKRCQTVLIENDSAFLDSLDKYFCQMLAPEAIFASVIIPRAQRIYFNTSFTPQQRLVARRAYILYWRDYSDTRKIDINSDKQVVLPGNLGITVSNLLEEIRQIGLPRIGSYRQKIAARSYVLSFISKLNVLDAYFMQLCDLIRKQFELKNSVRSRSPSLFYYDHISTEIVRDYIIAAFYNVVKTDFNYAAKLDRLLAMQSIDGKQGFLFLGNHFLYAIDRAQFLKVLQRLVKANLLKAKMRSVKLSRRDIKQLRLENWQPIARNQQLSRKKLIMKIINSPRFRDVLTGKLSVLLQQEIATIVEDSASLSEWKIAVDEIVKKCLIPFCMYIVSNKNMKIESDRGIAFHAYCFLLKPEVVSILQPLSKMFVYTKIKEQFSEACQTIEPWLGSITQILEQHVNLGSIALDDFYTQLVAQCDQFSACVSLVEKVDEQFLQTVEDRNFDIAEAKKWLEQLKEKRQFFYHYNESFYKKYINPLCDYATKHVAFLRHYSNKLLLQQLKTVQDFLAKDRFLYYFATELWGLYQKELSPKNFVSTVLETHLTNKTGPKIGDLLNQANQVISTPSNNCFCLFSATAKEKLAALSLKELVVQRILLEQNATTSLVMS